MSSVIDRRASEEVPASPLAPIDFWAGVQNGQDVQISVALVCSYVIQQLQATIDGLRAENADQAEALRKLKVKLFLDL